MKVQTIPNYEKIGSLTLPFESALLRPPAGLEESYSMKDMQSDRKNRQARLLEGSSSSQVRDQPAATPGCCPGHSIHVHVQVHMGVSRSSAFPSLRTGPGTHELPSQPPCGCCPVKARDLNSRCLGLCVAPSGDNTTSPLVRFAMFSHQAPGIPPRKAFSAAFTA